MSWVLRGGRGEDGCGSSFCLPGVSWNGHVRKGGVEFATSWPFLGPE